MVMNHRTTTFSIALFASTVALSRPALAADTYTIDPRHTSIVFSVGHAGLSYTYGMFRTASGSYVIDKDLPENSSFQLEIQTESLFTNDAERDTHLRSPDFFNAVQFPTIKFESTACEVTKTPERGVEFILTGNLTMHGVTRRIKVPMQMLAEGPGAHRDQRTGFHSAFTLKRSEFGMKGLLENNMVGDAVSVTISFEGALAAPGAQPRTR
jgi:polyisoprenoid-binding protein YceI